MLDAPNAEPAAGGTILGIHNLAIVFPQFIVSYPRTSRTGENPANCS